MSLLGTREYAQDKLKHAQDKLKEVINEMRSSKNLFVLADKLTNQPTKSQTQIIVNFQVTRSSVLIENMRTVYNIKSK